MATLTGRHFTDKELEAKAIRYSKNPETAETLEKLFTPEDFAMLAQYLNLNGAANLEVAI